MRPGKQSKTEDKHILSISQTVQERAGADDSVRPLLRFCAAPCKRYEIRSDGVGEIRFHFVFAKITNRAVVDSPSTLARRWTQRRSRRDSFAFLPLAKISEAASVCTGGRHRPPDCADFQFSSLHSAKKSRPPRWEAVILAV